MNSPHALNRRLALFTVLFVIALSGLSGKALSQEAAVDYLYQGTIAKGENALATKLQANPKDDQTRFALGVIQFGRALEHLLQDLNRHGFLTERTFGPVMEPKLRELFPDYADPQVFSHEVFRKMVQTWVNDVTKAEATLAAITDPDIKLNLKPALIQIVPTENGNPVNAARLLEIMFGPQDKDTIVNFGLTLDRGDVHWLRGYLHLQAAVGEFLLAHNFNTIIEVGAHRVFENVKTPHTWLLKEDRNFDDNSRFDSFILPIIDAVAVATLALDIPIDEPKRLKNVLDHLQGTIENGQEMWKHILAETDDENEWIPNPKQTGAIGVAVSQDMIDTWLETLAEAKRIVDGDKLVPFWRDYLLADKPGKRGINILNVFENPPESLAIVLWVQGTAATPYLEQGKITEFADEKFLRRINTVFGANFFGFAAWFN